jgi:two-component system OmpR family response regulator
MNLVAFRSPKHRPSENSTINNSTSFFSAQADAEVPSPARILIVDDEFALRDMLSVALRRAGFFVKDVADGQAALDTVAGWAPELIIVDIMLPGIDGFALLPELRHLTEVPIIILSARSETEEKIAGLSRGADDYIAKPFEIPELIARIHSALRRPRLGRREILRYRDLVVDVEERTVFRGQRRIRLSSREFTLLSTLLQYPEHVFTRDQLLDLVWGSDSSVFPNTLETYISYLRAKIDSGERTKLIKTLRGVGYTLRD